MIEDKYIDAYLYIEFINHNNEIIICPVSCITEKGLSFVVDSDKFDFRKGEKLNSIKIFNKELDKFIEHSEIVYCSIANSNSDIEKYKIGLVFESSIIEFRAREPRINLSDKKINVFFEKEKDSLKDQKDFIDITNFNKKKDSFLQDISKYGLSILVKNSKEIFNLKDILTNISLNLDNGQIFRLGTGVIVNLEFIYNCWLLRIAILDKEVPLNDIIEIEKIKNENKLQINGKILEDFKVKNFIDNNFKDSILDLRYLLDSLKYNFEIIEEKNKYKLDFDVFSDEVFIKAKEEFFSEIDKFFIKLNNIYKNLDIEKKDFYKKYFFYNLKDFILTAPINRAIFYKRYGHFVNNNIARYIYPNNSNENLSLFSKFIQDYTLHLPLCSNYKKTTQYLYRNLQNLIDIKLRDKIFIKVSGFISGFCYEIFDLIRFDKTVEHCDITLYFLSKNVLKYSKTIIEDLKIKHNKYVNVQYEYIPIYKLFSKDFEMQKQDIIYTFGVSEYLEDFYFDIFFENIFNFLDESGRLFIGQPMREDDFNIFYDLGLDLKIVFRDLEKSKLKLDEIENFKFLNFIR